MTTSIELEYHLKMYTMLMLQAGHVYMDVVRYVSNDIIPSDISI